MRTAIPSEEYVRARAEFRTWETRGNFLFSMRAITIAALASVVAYIFLLKWWILIVTGILLLDLAKKEGIREGYIYGFEYGMERGFRKGRGLPDEDPSDEP